MLCVERIKIISSDQTIERIYLLYCNLIELTYYISYVLLKIIALRAIGQNLDELDVLVLLRYLLT